MFIRKYCFYSFFIHSVFVCRHPFPPSVFSIVRHYSDNHNISPSVHPCSESESAWPPCIPKWGRTYEPCWHLLYNCSEVSLLCSKSFIIQEMTLSNANRQNMLSTTIYNMVWTEKIEKIKVQERAETDIILGIHAQRSTPFNPLK